MKPPNHGCRVRVTDVRHDDFEFEGYLALEDRIEGTEWRGLMVRDEGGIWGFPGRYHIDSTMRIELVR